MILAPQPDNELLRIQSLKSLNILDTPKDIRFDDIVEFATQVLDIPICFISLIDVDRQWFKSAYGLDYKELPRNISFCGHAIYDVKTEHPSDRFFEVQDANTDERFLDNPQVVDGPKIQSYLGYVLQSDSGQNIGTLCAVDTAPRKFSNKNKGFLVFLGSIVENLIYERHYLAGMEHKSNLH